VLNDMNPYAIVDIDVACKSAGIGLNDMLDGLGNKFFGARRAEEGEL
jgi:hypothetical protein